MGYRIGKDGDRWVLMFGGWSCASCWENDGRAGESTDGISAEKRARMVKFIHEWWPRLISMAGYGTTHWTPGVVMERQYFIADHMRELQAAIRQVEEGDKPKTGNIVRLGALLLTPDQARALRDEIDKQLGSPA